MPCAAWTGRGAGSRSPAIVTGDELAAPTYDAFRPSVTWRIPVTPVTPEVASVWYPTKLPSE